MMGHHLIFFEFSDSTWTRLSVNGGWDAESLLTGLHDHLTLILLIFGCGVTYRLVSIQSRSMT
jgi:hypothetical protein